MADVNIDATTWMVFIDPGTGFKVVACGKTNDLDATLSVIDYSSKCGNLYGPGSKFDQTINFEGNAIDQTITVSKESYQQIYDLFVAKTPIPTRFGIANPGATDHYFYGSTFVEAFQMKAPYNDALQFTCKFRVAVPPMALYTGY